MPCGHLNCFNRLFPFYLITDLHNLLMEVPKIRLKVTRQTMFKVMKNSMANIIRNMYYVYTIHR